MEPQGTTVDSAAAPIPIARRIPALGSAPWLLRDPLRFLREETERLGPVFRIRAATRTLVVLAGPEANRFATGPGRSCFQSKSFWGPFAERLQCPHVIIAIDGPEHTDLRRAYRDDLSRGVVADRVPDVVDTVRRVTAEVFGAGPASMRRYARVLVSSQISRLLTGRDMLRDVETLEAVIEFQRWQMNALLLGKWPTAALMLPRFRHYERTTRAFVAHHRSVVGEASPVGWFASMERARESHPHLFGEGDVDMHHLLPYFAGVDTVGVTLTFVMQELLADDGRLWRAVRDEVDAACADTDGGDLPGIDVPGELPLLNGTWREALRLYPAAFGVYRTAARDFTFRERLVHEGEDVLLFTTAAHTDPDVFPNPYVFDPERGAAAYRQGHAFAPYGKGPHVCLGAGMAEVLMPLVIASWVREHEFAPVRPGHRYGVVFDPTPTLPERFRVRWTARSDVSGTTDRRAGHHRTPSAPQPPPDRSANG